MWNVFDGECQHDIDLVVCAIVYVMIAGKNDFDWYFMEHMT